jgi:hypothetical protein
VHASWDPTEVGVLHVQHAHQLQRCRRASWETVSRLTQLCSESRLLGTRPSSGGRRTVCARYRGCYWQPRLQFHQPEYLSGDSISLRSAAHARWSENAGSRMPTVMRRMEADSSVPKWAQQAHGRRHPPRTAYHANEPVSMALLVKDAGGRPGIEVLGCWSEAKMARHQLKAVAAMNTVPARQVPGAPRNLQDSHQPAAPHE